MKKEKRRRFFGDGLPVEDGNPINLNRAIEGRGLHGTFILLGVGEKLERRQRQHQRNRQRQAGRFRERSPALADAGRCFPPTTRHPKMTSAQCYWGQQLPRR